MRPDHHDMCPKRILYWFHPGGGSNIYPGVNRNIPWGGLISTLGCRKLPSHGERQVMTLCHPSVIITHHHASSRITTRHRDRLQSRISSVFRPNLADIAQEWFPIAFVTH